MTAGPPTIDFGRVVHNFDSRRVPMSSREREQRQGRFPYYGAAGIIDYVDQPIFSGLYLLVGEDGSVVKEDGTPFLQLASGEFWVNNHAHVLQGGDDIDTRYLYYALSATDIRPYVTGAVQPKLSQGNMNRVPIPYPDRDCRESIVAVLGSLDNKIEQNRRTSDALERLARATFKAWFVDFEPVRAKADGAKSFPGMPSAAFATLTDSFEDSVEELPQGWGSGTLGDYCQINGQSVRPGEIDGEIEYIDIASVTVGKLDVIQPMPFSEAPSRARRKVAHGDTIWSCVRPNRRSYLFIHSPPVNRIASTGFAVLSPSVFGASYLYELATRQEFVEYLVANADGSAYPAVRPEHFARAKVVVPPASLREAFEGVTMPLRDLIAAGEVESFKLAALRDYLLPRLMSGDVRVSSSGGHLDVGV